MIRPSQLITAVIISDMTQLSQRTDGALPTGVCLVLPARHWA
ncbi:hypothetical protein [Williamsia sp. 1135]|nr:hypothetical protein [Williamsia sp. 1135]